MWPPRSHEEVVTLIKKSGKELRITMERGENLIPNMSMLCRPEDWVAPAKEPNFYLVAATEDITVPNSYRKKEKVQRQCCSTSLTLPLARSSPQPGLPRLRQSSTTSPWGSTVPRRSPGWPTLWR